VKKTYHKPQTDVVILNSDDLMESDLTANSPDTDGGAKQMDFGDIWDESDMDYNPWDD
jgi:hypothetical protein